MLQVDTREPKGLRDLLMSKGNSSDSITVVVETLRHGEDFIITDRDGGCAIAFQRKTITDFLSSLGSGSLDHQLQQMKDFHRHGILILEGTYGVDQDHNITTRKRSTGWHVNSFTAKLTKIGLRQGIGVIPTPSYEETAAYLLYLNNQAENTHQGLSRLV